MKLPIDNYNNVLTLLKLEHFGPLFEYFDYQARKTMSIYIINNALDNETVISTPEQVSHCECLSPDQVSHRVCLSPDISVNSSECSHLYQCLSGYSSRTTETHT